MTDGARLSNGKFFPIKQTKADKIRQMSDEELVDAWYYIYYHVIFASTDSRQGLLEWLKQEAPDDNNEMGQNCTITETL